MTVVSEVTSTSEAGVDGTCSGSSLCRATERRRVQIPQNITQHEGTGAMVDQLLRALLRTASNGMLSCARSANDESTRLPQSTGDTKMR